MNLFDIGLLIWIGVVVIIWLIIRRLRPDLLGLGDDFNKQAIDGVKLSPCSLCHVGQLAPYFKDIEKRKGIGIPPGLFYIAGAPDEYRCTTCDYRTQEVKKKKYTRISLAYPLPKGYVVKFIIKFLLLALLFAAVAVYINAMHP